MGTAIEKNHNISCKYTKENSNPHIKELSYGGLINKKAKNVGTAILCNITELFARFIFEW